jgi:hypothetical protein
MNSKWRSLLKIGIMLLAAAVAAYLFTHIR